MESHESFHDDGMGLNQPNSMNRMNSDHGSVHARCPVYSVRSSPDDFHMSHLGQEMESWPHTTNEDSNHTFVTNDKKVHDKGELDHRRRPRDLYSPHLGQEMESWPHTINENSNQPFFKYGEETSDTGKISHQGQDQNQTHHRSVRGLTSFPSFGERGSTPHNDPSYRSEFNNFRANSGKNGWHHNLSKRALAIQVILQMITFH